MFLSYADYPRARAPDDVPWFVGACFRERRFPHSFARSAWFSPLRSRNDQAESIRWSEREDVVEGWRIRFADEFLDDPVGVQSQLMNEDGASEGLFEGLMKERKRHAQLAGEELKPGDFARTAADPPLRFPECDRALPADGPLIVRHPSARTDRRRRGSVRSQEGGYMPTFARGGLLRTARFARSRCFPMPADSSRAVSSGHRASPCAGEGIGVRGRRGSHESRAVSSSAFSVLSSAHPQSAICNPQ
jgi:hypothetical protein